MTPYLTVSSCTTLTKNLFPSTFPLSVTIWLLHVLDVFLFLSLLFTVFFFCLLLWLSRDCFSSASRSSACPSAATSGTSRGRWPAGPTTSRSRRSTATVPRGRSPTSSSSRPSRTATARSATSTASPAVHRAWVGLFFFQTQKRVFWFNYYIFTTINSSYQINNSYIDEIVYAWCLHVLTVILPED